MVSIHVITIDRYEITKRCLDETLKNADYPYELLVYDNGSKDRRIIHYINTTHKPAHYLLNSKNVGIYKAFNHLISKGNGDYHVVIGNDIILPKGWLRELVETYKKIPNAGIAGIHCVQVLPPIEIINGTPVRPIEKVFGTAFFSKEFLSKVGYFNEDYTPYGLGDSDLLRRSVKSGLTNFYLPDLRSRHVGEDMRQDSEYRKMKTQSLHNNSKKFDNWMKKYEESQNYFIPLKQ